MSLTRTGPGPVWAKGGEMVTMSLGSAVSGISKASGGRLSRRLTLTVTDAMFARDWREGMEGALGRGCLQGSPSHLPSVPQFIPYVPSLGLEPCRDPMCPRVGLWASVCLSCDRLGLSLGPTLTDSTSISVIFQKAFQKCTSRF